MITLTFITADEHHHVIEAAPGLSLMEAAVRNGIAGITADCGGACACATCHVTICPQWTGRIGPAAAHEADLLAFAEGAGPASRLACQIELAEAHDGLVVRVP